MKTNRLTTLFAILATTLLSAMLFAGCGGEEATEETTEPAAAEPAAEEATEEVAPEPEPAAEPAAEAEPAAAGGSACERAQDCCEAYVEEMNSMGAATLNAEQTCAGIAAVQNAPTADSSCEQMITGWRTGLETAQRDVPGACAAP